MLATLIAKRNIRHPSEFLKFGSVCRQGHTLYIPDKQRNLEIRKSREIRKSGEILRNPGNPESKDIPKMGCIFLLLCGGDAA